MQKTITSSVIICTRNRPDDLRVCLDSIATQTMMPWEWLIVDSSDIPLSEQRVFNEYFSSIYFPNITLIDIHNKPELTHQRNVGIMRSTGDVLYFFDDDVKLERNYLECMNSIFIQHPHYGGGMGSVINIFPPCIVLAANLTNYFFIATRLLIGIFHMVGYAYTCVWY
jgi:glycosyltransferase involved in cell wall biosynthesis